MNAIQSRRAPRAAFLVALTVLTLTAAGATAAATRGAGAAHLDVSEHEPELFAEELRLFPGGEMAARVDLVEVDERRVRVLDPAARGERVEADRIETAAGA